MIVGHKYIAYFTYFVPYDTKGLCTSTISQKVCLNNAKNKSKKNLNQSFHGAKPTSYKYELYSVQILRLPKWSFDSIY